MKRAVQFGAGNIGRGFLGQLFYESDYFTTFVDVVEPLVRGLHERGGYPIRVLDEQTYMVEIRNVDAVPAHDVARVADALADADLAATAVGVPVLPKVAPLVAAGLERRFARTDAPPLNIIVCENLLDAGPYLREQVRAQLSPAYHRALDERVGFVEASIGRMVPVMTEEQRREDPLLVCVEEYCELPVDRAGFRGPVPLLKNMEPRDNFGAYVERKLFVHNAGHAATAYLGYRRGHEYIWQAIEDPVVREAVDAALAESCAGLVRRHQMDPAALDHHKNDLIRRFANRKLGDQVERVARDPLRKLGPRDRLIGAANMCLEQGVEPRGLAFAAAAAIRYDHPADLAALRIQELIARDGLMGFLAAHCGLNESSPLPSLIEAGLVRLEREGWIEFRGPKCTK